MIATAIMILLIMIILPFFAGSIWHEKQSEYKFSDYLECYILGWIWMFAAFEIIGIPLTLMKCHLRNLQALWLCIMGITVVWSIYKNRGVFKKKSINLRHLYTDVICRISIIALILFQCILQIFFQHIDEDDAIYVGMAVTSYMTDTIYTYSPYTGDLLHWSQVTSYLLSPYSAFWAMLGKICDIHPAILMHTVLPAVFIFIAYGVYYLLAKQFFGNDERKVRYTILFMCVINLFGFSSVRTVAAMLLFRVWQGKAMAGAIWIPFLIYYLNKVKLYEEDKKHKWKVLIILLAMDLATSMGIFLGLLTTGIYLFIPLLVQKKWAQIINSIWMLIPNMVLGITYALIR